MKIAYFDCFAGISGDMTLGALVDAGLDFEVLKADLAKLRLNDYEIQQEKVVKQGMSGTKVHVLAQEGHVHRNLQDIAKIMEASDLDQAVKDKAIAVFRRLAEAEAKVHGTTVDQIHFHEVGAVDAIIDIVGAVIGLWRLGIEKVYASALHTGKGFTKAAHGTIPIPAPATLELLRGIPVYTQDIPMELVTPTGAAILSTFCQDFGNMPLMEVTNIGYGAGDRELMIPNLLRVIIGEKRELSIPDPIFLNIGGQLHEHKHVHEHEYEHGYEHGEEHEHHGHLHFHLPEDVPVQGHGNGHDHWHRPPHFHEHRAEDHHVEMQHEQPHQEKPVHEAEYDHDRNREHIDKHTLSVPPRGESRFLMERSIQTGPALMLEANIDDMNPEFYDYLLQKFLKEGAMDAFLQPIQMKKNRPAVILSVQIHPSECEKFTQMILKETTSIGVRVYPVTKYMLPYEVVPVETPWGEAHVKIVRAGEAFQTVAPEYEDCRKIAEREKIPLKVVYDEVKRIGAKKAKE